MTRRYKEQNLFLLNLCGIIPNSLKFAGNSSQSLKVLEIPGNSSSFSVIILSRQPQQTSVAITQLPQEQLSEYQEILIIFYVSGKQYFARMYSRLLFRLEHQDLL